MWWPGSYTFYHNQQTYQIYCGDGHKFEETTYYPIHPPKMIDERPEKKVADEPNPTEEWLKQKEELEAKKAAQNNAEEN